MRLCIGSTIATLMTGSRRLCDHYHECIIRTAIVAEKTYRPIEILNYLYGSTPAF